MFQPETRESDEFCEDIPDVARSVFVMEYLHSLLPEMAIDFRIIRDINEVGRYATLDDVLAIDDLEAATVYYEPATNRARWLFIRRAMSSTPRAPI